MSVTCRQLTYQACRILAYAKQGMTIPPDLESDAFTFLNQLIESLNLDKLWVFTELISVYNLVPNQYIYTIGPSGANFTATRPLNIEQANVILNNVTPVIRKPLDIITYREWSAIQVQSIPSAFPNVLYYDRAFINGKGTIYLWPGPFSNYQLEIYTWQQMAAFADISSTSYTFAPGYERALKFLLAWELLTLAPEKFKGADKTWLREMKTEARQAIEDYNALPTYMQTDPAFTSQQRRIGNYNYLDGTVGGPGSL